MKGKAAPPFREFTVQPAAMEWSAFIVRTDCKGSDREQVRFIESAIQEALAGGWRDCRVELPQPMQGSLNSEECLIVCSPQDEADYFVARYNHNRRCWDDGDYQDNIPGVTHWRPLPAAPGEEEESAK